VRMDASSKRPNVGHGQRSLRAVTGKVSMLLDGYGVECSIYPRCMRQLI
jgi:hypothetical protein